MTFILAGNLLIRGTCCAAIEMIVAYGDGVDSQGGVTVALTENITFVVVFIMLWQKNLYCSSELVVMWCIYLHGDKDVVSVEGPAEMFTDVSDMFYVDVGRKHKGNTVNLREMFAKGNVILFVTLAPFSD